MTNILMIEPYYGGSHRTWIDGYIQHSRHIVDVLSMPAQFWKWRMQGGAVTMAREFQALPQSPDLIIASDMMDVSLFRAITRTDTPIVLYFHENQLTYPQNQRQHHGWQYGFINYASALASDHLCFNSQFHHDSFFDELPRMLKHFADYNELQTIEQLKQKAQILPLGLNLTRFDAHKTTKSDDTPLILWNHRWEADKNPKEFFQALYTLDNEGLDFNLALVGENFRQNPKEFERAHQHFGDRVLHYGYTGSFADYAQILWQADYIVSPSYQDFFGISVSEAIYCGCIPILAHRLNYPHLIPPDYHTDCLYKGQSLAGLLRAHLQNRIQLDTAPLQTHITQYEWTKIAPLYDATFQSFM